MELTEEQRRQVEANRAAAIAKRKAFLESREEEQQQQKNPEGENNSNTNPNPWNLFKCQKFPLSPKPQPPKSKRAPYLYLTFNNLKIEPSP